MNGALSLETVQSGIAAAVRDAAERLWGARLERIVLERPPSLEMGDLASPVAFDLAKSLRKAPRAIATDIASAIVLPHGVREVRVEGGGYLNFFLDRGRLVESLLVAEPAPPAARPGKIVVEHTNINPNKAAHIGHLRNAALGDVLARTLTFLGHRVEVQNYLDDTGVQVADVVAGLQHIKGVRSAEDMRRAATGGPLPDGSSHPKGLAYLCWDVYADVAKVYEENEAARGWRAEVLHAIEAGDNETARIAEVLSEAIVSAHLATMGRLGIAYDLLPRESDILRKHFWSRAFELLKRSGAVQREEEGRHAGCWVLRLSESPEFAGMEEPDKILVRSNGTVTYTAKDIAYQLWKFGLLGIDFDYEPFRPEWNSGAVREEEISREVREHPLWRTAHSEGAPDPPDFGRASSVINVIDVRQSYLQKVVREGLRVLGYASEAEKSVHFSYEMVGLTPRAARELADRFQEEYRLSPEDEKKPFVEMSGRKGLGVKIDDLVELLFERSRAEIAARRRTADDAAEQDARAIAVGALRYFLLKFGRNKLIAFDFDEALNFEGDTGPYLQYSLVRADNIFRKLEERGLGGDAAEGPIPPEGWDDDLWALVLDAAAIPEVAERAVDSLELSTLARHAFGLAQAFNHFYHQQPIVNEKDPVVRARRLVVAKIFRRAMSRLLGLLGIPEPGRM
ncbi:MAG TPA: arginine--tRNA ligase [Thermoanaerobaculia bacterium]|nr:arginine--tRNA ligase [Thermoanaerobaculia bacterium]